MLIPPRGQALAASISSGALGPIAGADYERAHEELAKAASDIVGSSGRGAPPAGGPAPPAYGGPPSYGAPPRGPPPPGPPGPYGPPSGAAFMSRDAAQLRCWRQILTTASCGESLREHCGLGHRSTKEWVWRPASWAGTGREATLRRATSETILEAAHGAAWSSIVPYICRPMCSVVLHVHARWDGWWHACQHIQSCDGLPRSLKMKQCAPVK